MRDKFLVSPKKRGATSLKVHFDRDWQFLLQSGADRRLNVDRFAGEHLHFQKLVNFNAINIGRAQGIWNEHLDDFGRTEVHDHCVVCHHDILSQSADVR